MFYLTIIYQTSRLNSVEWRVWVWKKRKQVLFNNYLSNW